MKEQMYGYIRVSTKDQNEARQLAAMQEFGVCEKNMVVEKLSGKDFCRPLYQKLIARLQPNDVLVVKSIDRLGRNYTEILDQWTYLTKKRNIAIVVLDMPLLDTRQGRDLTGTLISDIVLQLLSYIAETERQNIHQRQAEGIAEARKRGIQFGRKRIAMPQVFVDLAMGWKRGEISSRAAAEQLGVSYQTFLRRAKEFCEHASG
ncbi:recombinase family protein [Agathobaculum sp. Marseille-P7918]|uniref:recombinase family protein n=1 Tax=Agathobaculum sp. Marseille-P7918 TaxID=2479843 RepID=UPI003568E57A